MCKDHSKSFGKNSVILLTESRELNNTCEDRTKYLERQVRSFIGWLNEQGLDGKAIVLAIHHNTKRLLEEPGLEEFIWTTMREDSDSLSDTMAGKDDMEYRLRDLEESDSHFEASLHVTAYRAFMKSLKEDQGETPYNKRIYEQVVQFLDKMEEDYNPTAPRQERLPRSSYKACMKWKKKLNQMRFSYYVITYAQWAYLTNWINVLTSWEDKETGEIKQYPCQEQNVLVDELNVLPEDVEYEIAQVYYTRD